MRLMRLAVAALLVAACAPEEYSAARTIDIAAHARSAPAPGVTVISHAADGTVIQRVVADAAGRATIGVNDRAFVSVVFPAEISVFTPTVSVVTTVPPVDQDELAIHGPGGFAPSEIIGVLELDGPSLNAADYFRVNVGCALVRVTALPSAIDVDTCSLGTDQELDVLVLGYHDEGGDPPAPVLDGYAAGRVAVVDGRAVLALPAWQTSGPPVSLTLDGVRPLVEWAQFSDGLAFVDEPLPDPPFAYANLAIDETRMRATLVGDDAVRLTDRFVAGVPPAISFGAADFLPAFTSSTSIAATTPETLAWDAEPTGADAVHLHATWQNGTQLVVWDAVLPPDATSVALPRLGDDLATVLAGLAAVRPNDVVLRHVESSELADFDAVQAAGLHAEETVLPSEIVPRAGQIRSSYAIGVR